MSLKATYRDAFNMLCGERIGEGAFRTVYECRIRDDLVVKVEASESRHFSNVMESKFHADHQFNDRVARWLAPIEYLSLDGRILLQKRVRPVGHGDVLPTHLPAFLTDIKRENFGWLNGELVCIDYAMTIPNPSVRMRKAEW